MNAPDWSRGDRIGVCVDRNMVTRDRRTPIMNWVMGVFRCFGNARSEIPETTTYDYWGRNTPFLPCFCLDGEVRTHYI